MTDEPPYFANEASSSAGDGAGTPIVGEVLPQQGGGDPGIALDHEVDEEAS